MSYGYVRNEDIKPVDWSSITKIITDRFAKAEKEEKERETTTSVGDKTIADLAAKLPYGQSQGQNDFLSQMSDALKKAGVKNAERYAEDQNSQLYLRNTNAMNTEITNFIDAGTIYNQRVTKYYDALNKGETGMLDGILFDRIQDGFDFRNKTPFIDENYNTFILTKNDDGTLSMEDNPGKIFNSSDLAILSQRPFSTFDIIAQTQNAVKILGDASDIQLADGTVVSGIAIAGNPKLQETLGVRYDQDVASAISSSKEDYLNAATQIPSNVYEILLQSGYTHTFNPKEQSDTVMLLNGDGSIPTDSKFYTKYVEAAKAKLGQAFDSQLSVSYAEAPVEDELDEELKKLRISAQELANAYNQVRNTNFFEDSKITDKQEQEAINEEIFRYAVGLFNLDNATNATEEFEVLDKGLAALGFTLDETLDDDLRGQFLNDSKITIDITSRATNQTIPITIPSGITAPGMIDLVNQLYASRLLDENLLRRMSQNAGLINEDGVLIPPKTK